MQLSPQFQHFIFSSPPRSSFSLSSNGLQLHVECTTEKNKSVGIRTIIVPLGRTSTAESVDAVMARELWDHIKPFGSDERIIACCRRSVQYHIGKFHADIKYEYPKTDKTPEIKKKHAFYPHLLRHFRLTHLVTVYGMDGNYLKRFAGWGDVKMASHYVSFGTEDMAKKFM